MFESLSRGWKLTKTSFKVLKLDKEILTLPLLSGLLYVLVAATFLAPLISARVDAVLFNNSAAGLGYLFLFYVVAYFIMIFFNAAVIECATIRFNGGDPVVKDGLRKAWERKGRILQWAIVAATVGLILRLLENAARQSRNDLTRIVGEIAVSLVGTAWSIATYFVVPALVFQDLGPIDALKASAGTWKRAWGEGAGAMFSTGIIFFALGLLGLIPLFLGASIMGSSVAIGIFFIAIAVVYWLGLMAVSSAISGIVTAAIYKYAVDGRMPEAFEGVPVPQTGRVIYS